MTRLLHSKLFYIILLLIIGIAFGLLILFKNNDKKNDIPINFFVLGNYKNIGCLSVYIDDKDNNNEYSFDSGNTWQKSKYGAVYQNGEVKFIIRNQDKKIIYEKIMNIDSIDSNAPVIKTIFDNSVDNKSDNALLKDVTATFNGNDIRSSVQTEIKEEKGNNLLISYFVENDAGKCYLLKEAENKNIEIKPTPVVEEWVWPTDKSYQISRGVSSTHNGIDMYGPARGTKILAAHAGEVVAINSDGSSGYYVTIKHDNGYYARYAHMQNTEGNDTIGKTSSATKYISVGQKVQSKDIIGEFGSSGRSTGVHLHFEVWDGYPFKGRVLNPLIFYK